jgi:hypothetical protein
MVRIIIGAVLLIGGLSHTLVWGGTTTGAIIVGSIFILLGIVRLGRQM